MTLFQGFGQNFRDVAFHFDVVPDVFEFAVGADQKGAANDAQERAAEESFHAACAVGFDRFEIGVAEKIEIEFLLGFETGLGFHGIAAHTKDDYA